MAESAHGVCSAEYAAAAKVILMREAGRSIPNGVASKAEDSQAKADTGRSSLSQNSQEGSLLLAPPPEATQQADGSFLLLQEDGSTVRWTRRPDGAWRKPEHKRAGWSFRESSNTGFREPSSIEQPRAPSASSEPPETPKQWLERNGSNERERPPPAPRYEPPETPPEAAVQQEDGTFLLELDDGSTVRWTKRPNGTWRKPEHKKAGWVGDLERETYVVPAVRRGEHLQVDPDYIRMPASAAKPKKAQPTPERLAEVLKMFADDEEEANEASRLW